MGESLLNRSIPTALRNALLTSQASQLPLNFHLSPHITISQGRIFFISHRYRASFGIMWLDQSPLALTFAPGVAELLGQLPETFCWAHLAEALQRLGIKAADATQTIQELLRRDIIRSPLEWGLDCHNPALFLVEKLSQCPGEVVKEFREVLSGMDQAANSFSTAPTLDRVESLRTINSRYEELHRKLSPLPPPEIRAAIYEHAWMRGIDFQAGRGFTNLFQRLGQAIAHNIGVSSAYVWLRDCFVEQHGAGGVCEDIPKFIMVAWRKVSELMAGGKGGQQPAAPSAPDRFGGVAREQISVPLTFSVQIAGQNLEAGAGAEPRIILNKIDSRIGWQTVRWCDPDDQAPDSLRNQAKRWLSEACAPKIPVSITVSAESSTLQAHPRCLDQGLMVDGAHRPGDFKLSELVLKHNPKSNLLELTTRDHQPIQTYYLGALFPSVSWGPRYLAILLGEPFEVIQTPLNQEAHTETQGNVRHQERIEKFGCVVLRATWSVKADELARRLETKSMVDCLIAAQDFCQEFKIPRWVYAKAQIASWMMETPTKVKPVWLDFQNVACLEELLVMAKEFDWITLTEALPGPGENLLKIQGREHVSEFLFEAVFSATAKNQ